MTEKKQGTDIARVIDYFFSELTGNRPDRPQYSASYKRIEQLMHPQEDNLRSYSEAEMKLAVDRLKESGLVIKSINILYWPNLVSALVGEDNTYRKKIIGDVREMQIQEGFKPGMDESYKPDGW